MSSDNQHEDHKCYLFRYIMYLIGWLEWVLGLAFWISPSQELFDTSAVQGTLKRRVHLALTFCWRSSPKKIPRLILWG